MDSDRTFIIVGAGFAGAKAAETLRAEGFEGGIVLIGAEAERPYERPPLSKDYLRGEAEAKPYVHEEAFYANNQVELRAQTRVESVELSAAEVVLETGERLGYERLLLATGAEPRKVNVPGADLDGVMYLRTIADSEAIRDRIGAGGSLVTIGAGWIGAEVAASARQKGCDVTVIERASVPLERVLGPELGAIYREIHADHGVEVLTDTALEAFEGEGTLEAVRTADGKRIDADLVVVGVGVSPRTGLAEVAGIEVDNGVVVDDRLRTSAANVFAAGDLANADHPLFGRRIRVEHWANALNQGPAAARNMLGADRPYDMVPYFFSDQYDVGMEYAGYATDWDEVVFRGEPRGREFIAFWIKDGRVLAGMNVNLWDVTDDIQALVRSRERIDRDRLADPDVPLNDLVPAGSRPADS